MGLIVGDKDELIIEMPSVYNWLDINEQLNKQIPYCVCWKSHNNGLHHSTEILSSAHYRILSSAWSDESYQIH